MTTYSIIFSNKRNYRIARHSIFWIGWILYYAIFSALQWHSRYSFTKSFFSSLFEVAVSTPLDMAYCYAIIYFLIPRFLNKGRYIVLLLIWLLFTVTFIVFYEAYYVYILPLLRALDGLPKPPMPKSFLWEFFNLFAQINMEGCLAAAIKLGKMWHVKQQELDLIKNEKKKVEPLVDDSQIQPVFFIDILNRIELLVSEKPLVVAAMIKKIKNLLLYAMYDNNQSRVSLEKELELLKEYVELENISLDGKVNILLNINELPRHEQIAPFIILPFAENAFKQLSLHDIPDKKLDIDVRTSGGFFTMALNWSKPADTSTLSTGRGIVLQNISKRLNLIYPQSHELKVFIKVNTVVVNLKIDLRKAINK